MKNIAITCVILLFLGCSIGHQKFYSQVAPVKYQATEKTRIFEYANVDLKNIYDMFFSDFLIIGRSSFNGPYEEPSQSESYANSIGADIFITSSQFKETRTSLMPITTPTTNTTYVSGYSGKNFFQGTLTNYGTQTISIPIEVNRYDQTGLYLKNINKVVPFWEKTEDQYKKTNSTNLEGIWFDNKYKLNLFKSDEQLVAFVLESPKDIEGWDKGQLKFIFNEKSSVGIYLMGDKTPMPAKFNLNKFGHLEVVLILAEESFSFARQ